MWSAQRFNAVELIFILAEEAVLPCCSGDVGAGHPQRRERWAGPEIVAKGVARECGAERWNCPKSSEVKGLDVGIAHSAGTSTPALTVCLPRVQVTLSSTESSSTASSGSISGRWVKPVPELKLKVGKACVFGCWLMFTPVEVQLRERICAFDWEIDAGRHIGEAYRNSFKRRGVMVWV